MTRLLYGRDLVVASELDPTYLAILRNRFVNNPGVTVEQLDLNSEDYQGLREYKFDTVVCLNVLEHVEHDREALQHLYDVLVPGGRVILYVPADQKLFGSIDTTVGHFRRYSKEELDGALRDAGFVIEKSRYLNIIGRFGWWLNGQVFRRQHMPAGQSWIFDLMVPFIRRFEPENPTNGLSLLAIARKPEAAAAAERQEAALAVASAP
jgi:SAM-dependent methyltransferase